MRETEYQDTIAGTSRKGSQEGNKGASSGQEEKKEKTQVPWSCGGPQRIQRPKVQMQWQAGNALNSTDSWTRETQKGMAKDTTWQ